MVRVVAYSDQPILIKGLQCLIEGDPALRLDSACSHLQVFRQRLAAGDVDLALVDLTPEVSSAVLGDIRQSAPRCKLILWTTTIAAEFAMQALAMGIRGVLRKTLPLEAHRQCLHRIHAGELWFEKSITDSFRSTRRVVLSKRESQLVSLLSRGMKNREISRELGISEGTVKVYLSRLFQKSGARRFDLAVQGRRTLGLPGVCEEGEPGPCSLVMDPECHL
jgi:two-component system nitrate/nitrite response regulator NarL